MNICSPIATILALPEKEVRIHYHPSIEQLKISLQPLQILYQKVQFGASHPDFCQDRKDLVFSVLNRLILAELIGFARDGSNFTIKPSWLKN